MEANLKSDFDDMPVSDMPVADVPVSDMPVADEHDRPDDSDEEPVN